MSINVKTLYNNLGHRLNIIKLLKSSFFFHFFIVYIYIYIRAAANNYLYYRLI